MARKKEKRMIRDWTASEKIDAISVDAERFFIRLCMKADDYGLYYANPKMLKSNLFPLKDNMTSHDMIPLLEECKKVGLIRYYTAEEKQYLEIIDFGQKLRRMTHKFPMPEDHQSGEIPGQVTPPPAGAPNIKKGNIVDIWLQDLPNSTTAIEIASKLEIDLSLLKSKIPEFSKKAELQYPNQHKFHSHFKNWLAKNIETATKTDSPVKSTLSFGKKK